MVQRVYKVSKFNYFVDEENTSCKKLLIVNFIRPEAEWSNHEQVENFMVT